MQAPRYVPPPVLPQITVCTLTRSIPLLCFAPQLHKHLLWRFRITCSYSHTHYLVQAISRLLDMLLINLSADVQHVVECVTDGQSASALAVLWRVRGGQSNLLRAKVRVSFHIGVLCFCTYARECKTSAMQKSLHGPAECRSLCAPQGVTFMKVNGQNKICYIRDAPEHPIKSLLQTAPVANLATSMLARYPSSLHHICCLEAGFCTCLQLAAVPFHTGAVA